MRKSWLWFLITVVGYIVGQLVGYFVSSLLGYSADNYTDMSAMDRWILVLATLPFFVLPAFKMYLEGKHEASEGLSKAPMYVGLIIAVFFLTISILGGLGVSA